MHSAFFCNPKQGIQLEMPTTTARGRRLISLFGASSASFLLFHLHSNASLRLLMLMLMLMLRLMRAGDLVSISLTTGSIRVWSRLLCPSTKKGEELRYEAVLWMETPAEETPGGWASCYKGSAAFGLVLITASLLLLLVACQQDAAEARPLHSPVHRKLLRQESTVIDHPSRLPGGGCMRGDIVVIQGVSIPLPNGIPAYSVEIINQCPRGCAISAIHLSCGWFSSAHLVNPRVFRRLRYDDCLVNNGMPLHTRETLSFLYANTYPYPLSVSSVSCS